MDDNVIYGNTYSRRESLLPLFPLVSKKSHFVAIMRDHLACFRFNIRRSNTRLYHLTQHAHMLRETPAPLTQYLYLLRSSSNHRSMSRDARMLWWTVSTSGSPSIS